MRGYTLKSYINHCLKRGRFYRQFTNKLKELTSYRDDDYAYWQLEQLHANLKEAYEHVPYYRTLWQRLGLHPDDIHLGEDMHRLPMIDKSIVQSQWDDFVNRNYRGFKTVAWTGGSSGNPGRYLRDLRSIQIEEAFVQRFYKATGYQHGKKSLIMRGDRIVPLSRQEGPFHLDMPLLKKRLLSSYHLSEHNMLDYIKAIIEFGPDTILPILRPSLPLPILCIAMVPTIRFPVW
jgi:phenylacetate-CoA ligase